MKNQILVADQVAEWIQVDRQRIYELVRTKQIPVITLGERQYRFSKQAIENWLANGGSTEKGNKNESA